MTTVSLEPNSKPSGAVKLEFMGGTVVRLNLASAEQLAKDILAILGR